MNAPLYTVEILRLAASLPEPTELPRVAGIAEARSPACGSIVRTQVALGDDGRIEALSQQVQACAFGQASAAVTAGFAPGRDRDEVQATLRQLSSWLDGGEDAPDAWSPLAPARSRKGRHGAILLPLRALVQAMDNAR